MRAARRLFPFVEVIFADGAYHGEATAAAVAGTGRWRLEIVRRGHGVGFVPLPKRWIVERTFAWLGRCRRLAKDFENLAVNALAFLCLGMIRLMLRQLAKVLSRLTNLADRLLARRCRCFASQAVRRLMAASARRWWRFRAGGGSGSCCAVAVGRSA